MLYGARIGLLLLTALSANMVPACGRSFRPGGPSDRDVARAVSAADDAAFPFAALHYIPLIAAFASSASTTDVRYVANSGMLVTASGRRFLIDAPIRQGIAPYATSSAAERGSLEGARAPYAGVDAILITHWHEDHFSAEAVAAHLSSNPRAIVVSSPEVVERVRGVAPALAASRLRAVLPAPGQSQRVDVGGTPVRVLRIRHNPSRRPPEQHLGFLIGDSAPVLHVGDADPAADNFALLRSLPPIDLAFLPFWYVSDDTNRRLVADAIRPKRIVAMHVPPKDASKIAAALREANVGAQLAVRPGSPLAGER
jgi:L-ascorbate metabolism protein UlaG (beta-lactamase superfamily)